MGISEPQRSFGLKLQELNILMPFLNVRIWYVEHELQMENSQYCR